MPKGMYTQGVCVLLSEAVTMDSVESVLTDFELRGRCPASKSWAYGGETLVISYRPEVNGQVAVDLVNHKWPDSMGDSKTDSKTDLEIFGAWSCGSFGPFTFPNNLKRAMEQSWAWEDAKTIAPKHQAFIRIRSSYVFGAEENAPLMPKDYVALPELEFVTKMALKLLNFPEALCYFNPSGEVLRNKETMQNSLNFAWSQQLPPLDLWSNIRLHQLPEGWALMDLVGSGQFDLPDFEAIFHADSYHMQEVDSFLRNLSLYMLENGEVIQHGDTLDGPGKRLADGTGVISWRALQVKESFALPNRKVWRFFPMDQRPFPQGMISTVEAKQE